MRGYLQRLAASVSRPERRVRPLVGSIFAGELREESLVEEVQRPFAEQSTERAAQEPVARVTPQAVRGPSEAIAKKPSHALIPAPQQVQSSPQPDTPEPPEFALLLPRPAAQAESPVLRVQEKPLERPAGPYLRPAEITAKQEPERPKVLSETPPGFQPLVLRPLIVEEARAEATEARPQPAGTREPTRKTAIHMARQEPEERPAAAKEGERGASEDIQIHIGRIEVIAAAPQAPRAAASATTRSTSLEDYLKRRNGRAG
jgi:hypothetical protein